MSRSLAVLGVLCLAVVGCSASTPAESVDSAFASRALAVCSSVMASKQAWTPFPAGLFDPTDPDPAKLAQVGAWLDSDVIAAYHAWHDESVALGEPASGQAAWSVVVAGLAKTVELNLEQIAAAEAGDATAFASATRERLKTNSALIAATKAAGVEACGDIVAD